MKLSMWMIANRLSPLLDIKSYISSNAQPVLNSARLAYATNCVHVYPDGDHVVYAGEGDRILVYNLSVIEAFEILQGVFDYYQDWETLIQQDIKDMDFPSLIEHSWLVFHNPMMISDGNHRLLGMTEGHDIGEVDPEWQYQKKYRYASLKSIRMMRYESPIDFSHSGYHSYRFKPNHMITHGGLTYTLQFHSAYCGRITLLELNRELNIGDAQLLKKIADYITPVLGLPDTETGYSYNVFKDMILGNPFQETDLPQQLLYQGWTPTDTFQIAVILPSPEKDLSTTLNLMRNTLSRQFPDDVILTDESRLILLSNHDLSGDGAFRSLLLEMDDQLNLHVGFSLPLPGTRSIPRLLRQAGNALRYGMQNSPQETFYSFYASGIDFILNNPNLAEKVQACHPGIRKLWHLKLEHKSDYYDTLKSYLDNERSLSRTAAALFAHRNTVLYRLNKCWDYIPDDLESVSLRYYIRLSMFYVELASRTAPPSV